MQMILEGKMYSKSRPNEFRHFEIVQNEGWYEIRIFSDIKERKVSAQADEGSLYDALKWLALQR